MGIFENFDATTWLLFGLLAAAAIAYYLWPESTKADAEVGMDKATRKQAKPLIALAADSANEQLFELCHMPLRVRAGGKLKSGEPLDANEVREALWTQQRAMITRLEGELDYAQQADITDHFAIAAPANQPGALLQKTLKELESLHGQMRTLLKIGDDQPLWHGRALILMLSTRKLFDHVAWLTSAGLAASAPGAFMLWEDDIVMITIYATRVELGLLDDDRAAQSADYSSLPTSAKPIGPLAASFTRPLSLQTCRAAVCSVGGPQTPKWLEYGLAYWMIDQILGKPQLAQNEQTPKWSDNGTAIFDAAAWEKAGEDSGKLEQMVTWSMLFVQFAMAKEPEGLPMFLKDLRHQSPAGIEECTRRMRDLAHTLVK